MKPNTSILALSAITAVSACAFWLLPISHPTTRIKISRTSVDISGVEQQANQGGYDPYFNRVNFVTGYSPS
jgi:hypothetical protein